MSSNRGFVNVVCYVFVCLSCLCLFGMSLFVMPLFVMFVFCYAFLFGPRPLGPMGPMGPIWARGRGPLGQGPGPVGPGPKLQDTHGESNYLLSGRLPNVRQSYLLSGMHPTAP